MTVETPLTSEKGHHDNPASCIMQSRMVGDGWCQLVRHIMEDGGPHVLWTWVTLSRITCHMPLLPLVL